jgi:hypothetical protein
MVDIVLGGTIEQGLKLCHDGAVNIWPDCLFLDFTTIEFFEDPRIANLSSLYQMVRIISINSCGIIRDDLGFLRDGRGNGARIWGPHSSAPHGHVIIFF